MTRMRLTFVASIGISFGSACTLTIAQQPLVSVKQLYAGDRNVTGHIVSGSAPLTVYEILGTSRNYIGKSTSLDQQGYFAVAVSPSLKAGEKVLVVDALGHSSAIMTVIVKTGPAGPNK